ncbi:MAG: hypothetical protein SP1CHLAM54_04220 [Chlamydiia bacterium]|nr:hypothetical protein [Chlamydiia bacterium]MCH9615337.1 hypothetical protein [Chlamydiia bacterium]MCH9628341.1 hypothetical protein [Chlamydiia bacterium]
MIHALELEWINWIHQYRSPALDSFFKFLNYFDSIEFMLVLIPFIWLARSWKSGLRVLLILVLASIVNAVLKAYFDSPRPYHLQEHLGLLPIKGLGFPSGAAQTVVLLTGIAFRSWTSSLKWLLPFTYVPLISFSRVYLGAHFPTDILAGWLVGGVLLAIYVFAFPTIEQFLTKRRPITLLALLIILPLLVLVLFPSKLSLFLTAELSGIGIALYLSHHFELFLPPSNGIIEVLLRGLIGSLGLFLCYFVYTALFDTSLLVHKFLRLFITALWMGLGSHLACQALILRKGVLNA